MKATIYTALCCLALSLAACDDKGSGDSPSTDVVDASGVDAASPDATDGEALDVSNTEITDDSATTDDAATEVTQPQCPAGEASVVTFMTDDGVTLEADLHTTGSPDSPAVVLLHMIPPTHDRTNYPLEFRELLVDAGFTVLNVDRRGAGGSEGVAADAYEGLSGKLDAAASIAALAALPCPVDATRTAIVGASNGTTTAVDYTVDVASSDLAPLPMGLVFLTGGAYTENQHTLSDQLATLGPLPILFVYAHDEVAWSAQYEGASDSWTHSEFAVSGHGTFLFGAAPESMTLVRDYLVGLL